MVPMTKSRGLRTITRGTPEERWWAKVEKRGPDECWPWKAARYLSGYGMFGVDDGHTMAAHRFGYIIQIGPIPEGADLDHQCHNRDLTCAGGPTCLHRACCNPAHVEPASRWLNLSRGRTVVNRAPSITHCPHGHEYTPANTSRYGGKRKCRTCGNLRRKARYWAAKALNEA